MVVTATVIVMIAPILIFGAGVTGLADVAELIRFLVYVTAVCAAVSSPSRTLGRRATRGRVDRFGRSGASEVRAVPVRGLRPFPGAA